MFSQTHSVLLNSFLNDFLLGNLLISSSVDSKNIVERQIKFICRVLKLCPFVNFLFPKVALSSSTIHMHEVISVSLPVFLSASAQTVRLRVGAEAQSWS